MARIFPERKSGDKLVPFSTKLPQRVCDRLEEIAEAQDLPKSQVVRHLLEWAFAQYDREVSETKK